MEQTEILFRHIQENIFQLNENLQYRLVGIDFYAFWSRFQPDFADIIMRPLKVTAGV